MWIDKTSSNRLLILNTYHFGTCVNNNRTRLIGYHPTFLKPCAKCGSYYSAFIKPSGLFFSELCLLAIFDSFQFYFSTIFDSYTNTYFLKHI